MRAQLSSLLRWQVLLVILCYCESSKSSEEWDYLIFSQKWPVTFCIKYTHGMTDPTRTCLFPKNKEQWTIHGLWPNNLHGEGPFFCNMSVKFDVKKLAPIRSKLEDLWPNLEGGKSRESLWAHEWEKHGTCAITLESLNNERKYFEKGLDLYAKYNVTSLIQQAQIIPNNEEAYSGQLIFDRVQKVLTKAPYLECIKETNSRKTYLSEIRVCFDKDFQLIDCRPKHDNGDSSFPTNCPLQGLISYPKDVAHLEALL